MCGAHWENQHVVMHTVNCESSDEEMSYAAADTMSGANTENEKQPGYEQLAFPPEAKPFPRQQLARRVGPYLRRASRGEALIGDWGGWRLSGW